jgi:hypothetical protein
MWWMWGLGCAPPPVAMEGADACGDAGARWGERPVLPKDTALDWGDAQAKGTHNSYHQAPDAPLDPSWAYSQPPLAVQLADLGVRQLELDLHLRDGVYEVFHVAGVDGGTSCPTLTDCLQEICRFSAATPGHVPLTVWIELKDDVDLDPSYVSMLGTYAAIEDEIRALFPADRLVVPDDWRRGAADLATATATWGPPSLADVRGRTAFALLESSEHRDAYLAESPTLADRVLFPDSDGSQPYAALVKDADNAVIPDLIAAGLLVTVNADGAGDDPATRADTRTAALAAGAHHAASDFPAEWSIPGGAPVACNPVRAPADCAPADLERAP